MKKTLIALGAACLLTTLSVSANMLVPQDLVVKNDTNFDSLARVNGVTAPVVVGSHSTAQIPWSVVEGLCGDVVVCNAQIYAKMKSNHVEEAGLVSINLVTGDFAMAVGENHFDLNVYGPATVSIDHH